MVYTTGERKGKKAISLATAPDAGDTSGGFQDAVGKRLAVG